LMSKLSVDFYLKWKDKVYSFADLYFLLATKYKGISGFVGLGIVLSIIFLLPVYNAYRDYRAIKKQYESAYSDYQSKKTLILSSLEEIKKAKPLPMPTTDEFFAEIYSVAQLVGIDVSSVRLGRATMTLKSLRYPASVVTVIGKIYDDDSLKRFLLFTDSGWMKLNTLKVQKGNLRLSVIGAVKEDSWKRSLPRRF